MAGKPLKEPLKELHQHFLDTARRNPENIRRSILTQILAASGLAVLTNVMFLQPIWANYATVVAMAVLYLLTQRMKTAPSTVTVLTVGAMLSVLILAMVTSGLETEMETKMESEIGLIIFVNQLKHLSLMIATVAVFASIAITGYLCYAISEIKRQALAEPPEQ